MASERVLSVRFEEAIEWLRRRLRLTTPEWQAMLQGAQDLAERVVDEQMEAIGRDLLQAVLDTIEEGRTLEDFQGAYDAIMSEAGWGDRDKDGWHSALVFRMQTGNAYSAGRWEQAQRVIAASQGRTRYYFRYVTVGDHRVRDTHAQWHGIVLPHDHWFWRSHWPPNGFNCRCPAPQLISEHQLRRQGWTVTSDTDKRLAVPPDEGFVGNVGMAMVL
jgi:SPP1 gp7 family putative phage head morphogenesis protein